MDWLDPLLDAERMRDTDRWAIEERGIPSLALMEAAGAALANAARAASRVGGPARIVCGKGNNGGDGLVAARRLSEQGMQAEALLLWPSEEMTPDARTNLDRLQGARQVALDHLSGALEGSGVIVDALLGTGAHGAPTDPVAGAIEAINSAGAPVVAADIPSGIDASTGAGEGVSVQADATVTFHVAKVGHWVRPGKDHRGRLSVAPIGIPEGGPETGASGLISTRVLRLAPRRGAASTKFSSGQVVLVGASRGLTGALALAATSAIRSGAGYATACVPAELEPILEEKLTEVMTVGCADADGALDPGAADRIVEAASRAAAVLLGPGLGRSESALALGRELVGRIEAPLVVDADGLNAFAGRAAELSGRSAPTVLTPHSGELGRLLGIGADEVAGKRLESARRLATEAAAVVVLKGDDTIVVDGSATAIDPVSSPSLATAGTGDVLGGAIAALLARGMEPFAAACAGVLAHARAGVLAAAGRGAEHVIASDVIEELPFGFDPEVEI